MNRIAIDYNPCFRFYIDKSGCTKKKKKKKITNSSKKKKLFDQSIVFYRCLYCVCVWMNTYDWWYMLHCMHV